MCVNNVIHFVAFPLLFGMNAAIERLFSSFFFKAQSWVLKTNMYKIFLILQFDAIYSARFAIQSWFNANAITRAVLSYHRERATVSQTGANSSSQQLCHHRYINLSRVTRFFRGNELILSLHANQLFKAIRDQKRTHTSGLPRANSAWQKLTLCAAQMKYFCTIHISRQWMRISARCVSNARDMPHTWDTRQYEGHAIFGGILLAMDDISS